MAGRHQRLVWTQWTRPVPPSARPTDMAGTTLYGRTFGSTTISSSDWFNNELLDQFIQ
ncbi:unnamed protein product, partial [Rotaria magnacalcarata]